MDDPETMEKKRDLADWWRPRTPLPSRPELPAREELPARGSRHSDARGVVSIFGDNRKVGRWLVPERFRVFSVFGSAKVDLREAVLQHEITVIEALAICADIQIIVPPGVIVECDGDALLGAFTVSENKKSKRAIQPPLGGPVVRVEGSAYLASVTVKIRPPK
ncbi:MAG TPA: LiaF domain-containing protein [Gemmatimonadaceae bacterium]|jgi:hypothetical protein